MINFLYKCTQCGKEVESLEEVKGDKKCPDCEKILQLMEDERIYDSGDNFEACKAYLDLFGSEDLSSFEEAFEGKFYSDEEFAQEMHANVNGTKTGDWPFNCIDWELAARELMYDYTEQDGFYFRNV